MRTPIASIVFILCTITSGVCAFLLSRAYVRTKQRLLLWSSLCFTGLCLNNALLFADVIVFTNVDLSIWRVVPAVFGLLALCYGLIMEVG